MTGAELSTSGFMFASTSTDAVLFAIQRKRAFSTPKQVTSATQDVNRSYLEKSRTSTLGFYDTGSDGYGCLINAFEGNFSRLNRPCNVVVGVRGGHKERFVLRRGKVNALCQHTAKIFRKQRKITSGNIIIIFDFMRREKQAKH